jgi:hypothetical protein
MFSLANFYDVLYINILKPCNMNGQVLLHDNDSISVYKQLSNNGQTFAAVIFHDQEPVLQNTDCMLATNGFFTNIIGGVICEKFIFANSEISTAKDKLLEHYQMIDWYFFSHGFLALDWFRDAKYLLVDKTSSFDKVFIMFNNLTAKDRSYRLGIVADLLDRGLNESGMISLPLTDKYHGSYINEVFDTNSKLDKAHKKLILQTIHKLDNPLTIDESSVSGEFSAKLNLKVNQRAFWHIVPETNFYHEKLHLTEKIFKPIVSYRPFILASYAGNLKYLRSYGFKTFGDFIDESYDLETDNNKRMTMIVDVVEKLCKLTQQQQREMFEEMRPILEHNFNHFYGDFKKIIVDEMVYGFGETIDNRLLSNHRVIDDSALNYAAVATKLAS